MGKDKEKKKKKKKSSSSSSSSSDSEKAAPQKEPKKETAQGSEDAAKERGDAASRAKDAGESERRRREEAPEVDDDIEAYKKRKIADLEALGRSGGVYIPPFKLARMQEEIEDKTSKEYQRQTWEALRKSINGLVNKVNVGNIKNIVEELFQENLVRGRGLFVRALIRAQMASPGFTHVFVGLVAVINSKLPELGDLLIRRVILQFRRAYKRNDKIVTTAAIKFMAHLVNQKVCSELLALHVATLLLERVTDDSIEVCVAFMQEVGQAIQELSSAGSQAIFERFRTILHEGEIDRRVQYVIEGLFEVRRKKFADHPMVLEELDLVEDEDQITHEVDLLDETIKGDETLNIFKAVAPEQYAADEAKWRLISNEILGIEQDDGSGSSSDDSDDEADEAADKRAQEKIVDFTEQDLVNLRRSIYLVIMSQSTLRSACTRSSNST
jgi:pre-mRNA-splicing factor CWC22